VHVRVIEGVDLGTSATGGADKPLTVGTAPGNELQLRDDTVSRYHLELSVGEGGVRLRDLGSLNGTFLGAVRVESATVPAGATVRIGSTNLVVEAAGAIPTKRDAKAVAIPGFVAESEGMRRVASVVHKLAPTMVSVLIEGETGTGKELVARAIHDLGRRAAGPFVVVDCASLAPSLIASELFGHERGAFTGAERRHLGAFERAHGGTIFLDEVGELPLELQPTLLGVLERRVVLRVGGEGEVPVDVRVLSATNRDLRAAANQGSFRADLYFRLAVARITIPPLRERPEDIPALVEHFAAALTGVPGSAPFDEATLRALSSHHYGGNVRELRNIVESALATGELGALGGPVSMPREYALLPYREARAQAIAAFEQSYLSALIEASEGNASEAARRAKMDRPYLLALLRRHGLR
jgi:DNA-binding NtrC family response regulator